MSSSEERAPVVKYVGYKVAKVRWKPQPVGAIGASEIFASGSYEDEVNRICMWEFRDREGPEDSRSIVEPEKLCEWIGAGHTQAGISDLCFLDEQSMVASFEDGGVVLLKYLMSSRVLKQLQFWENLHHFPSGEPTSCTALAVCGVGGGVNVVTGGTDGRITVLRTSDLQPLTVIDNADNGIVTALSCSLQLEVLSTSSSGQLKIWDLRTNTDRPTKTIVISGEQCVSIESLDRHPQQPHIVAVGRGDGSVCFIDLRQPKYHTQVVKAHSDHVWEVKFDSSHPNNLFTCSQDGGLWHWDANSISSHQHAPSTVKLQPSLYQHHHHHSLNLSRNSENQHPLTLPNIPKARSTTATEKQSLQSTFLAEFESAGVKEMPTSLTSPWLSGALQHGRMHVDDFSPGGHSGISVNSLDIESEHLLCGTDSEALFIVPSLTLT